MKNANELSQLELTLRVLGKAEDIAELVGVSQRTVFRWKTDGFVTRRRDAKILAEAVQDVLPCVTVESLLREPEGA